MAGSNRTIRRPGSSGGSGTGGAAAIAAYTGQTPKPTAAQFENFSRYVPMTNVDPLVSGRENLCGIWLPQGATITSITYVSATTAANTPLNQWFTLRSSARVLLRATTDDLTTAWGASTAKTLNLSTPFVTTYTGFHYLGLMVRATTVPSFAGITTTATIAQSQAPVLSGPDTTNTGLTTVATAPATSGVPTQSTAIPYAYVS